MHAKKAYAWLLEYFRETARYDSIRQLLDWDQRTFLPKDGHAHRAAQLATLAGVLSKRNTDPKIGEMLGEVENSKMVRDPLADEAVNAREWRRSYTRACKIPEQLAVELTRSASEGESAWQESKPRNDWDGFLPHLERIVDLKREEASLLASGDEFYDALIEEFEPGERAERIDVLFKKLLEPLHELLDKILGAEKRPDTSILRGNIPVSAQEAFITHILACIGFDRARGRMDLSAHPFTSAIGPGDIRITTRYDENFFSSALFSAIHETGHALYGHGLPEKHWGTPRGSAVSMAIHESQSLMWENMVARSSGFWKRFYSEAQKHFHHLEAISPDDFYLAINEVRPDLIRTEADEVTYNLHIIMRFELERALIRREIEPDDLPEAWNEKMSEYLGIVPPDFASGVMQDVHWSGGAIGYFPSYALGNIYAAQLYFKAAEDMGSLDQVFESGNFQDFVIWLRRKIHSQGSRYLPRDLIKAATGEELNPDYLVRYLTSKYGELYAID
ncbi:MAG: carboxypeptidase M32 [Syntrophobacter sp.]